MKKDLQYLAYPARDWVLPRQHPSTQQHVYDVLVVGGGQCGLTTAFGLAKERVRTTSNSTRADEASKLRCMSGDSAAE